jgi:hypothetical protein
VVTDFPPNAGRLMWSGVDLTGVRELELRAAGESEPATPGFPQPEPPPRPAAGCTVEAHLGSPTGPLLGIFTIPANPGWQRTNPLAGNTMPQPGWSSYLVTLDTPVDGEHDLWLVAGPPSAVRHRQHRLAPHGALTLLTRADPPGHVSGRIST